MAHYLWNAGVLMAELVGGRPEEGGAAWRDGEWWVGREEERAWAVRGQRVIELGAGALG